MNRNLIRNGLIAAGVMNIGGVLLFSRAFTNSEINNADPVVMSNFGLLMIIVWAWHILVQPPSPQISNGLLAHLQWRNSFML